MNNKDEHHEQWIKNLKVGDKVIVQTVYISTSMSISSVVKITPKGSIRVNGRESMLFKNGGCGSECASYHLLEPTDERVDKIVLSCMRKKLGSTDWSKVSDEDVRDTYNLVHGHDFTCGRMPKIEG